MRSHNLKIIAGLLLTLGVATASDAAPPGVAQVSANLVKPISLTWLQDLDLGTIVLGPGTWSSATVQISRAGVFSCTSANVTCTGASQPAQYNVTGTNNQTVHVTAPNVTLINQSDATKTLTLVVDGPGTITLPNSGSKGTDFMLGGAITVSSATTSGVYVGTFNVTADY